MKNYEWLCVGNMKIRNKTVSNKNHKVLHFDPYILGKVFRKG